MVVPQSSSSSSLLASAAPRQVVQCRIGQPTHHTHPHLINAGELTPGVPATEYAARREAFFTELPRDSLVVVPAYDRKIMSHDIPWPFRQASDFLFLTGCHEPGTAAVFVKTQAGVCEWYLFVAPKTPLAEKWDGIQTGVTNAYSYFNPSAAFAVADFAARLGELFAKNQAPFEHTTYIKNPADSHGPYATALRRLCDHKVEEVKSFRGKFRVMDIKREVQVKMHIRSAEITKHAFSEAMIRAVPGTSEAEVYRIMENEVRKHGADWLAYPPVIAGGDRGLSLHYVQNQQILNDGDLLLVDAGAEYNQHPTDVTRTWPVSGTFTKPQRLLYNAVLDIQRQLLDAIKVGTTLDSLQTLTIHLTAAELLRIGVFKGSTQSLLASGWVTTVFPHAFGHFMGMDIHEPIPPNMKKFVAGHMHTIEPGIYLPHHPEIPIEFRGLCVRIEDNVLIGVCKGFLGCVKRGVMVTKFKFIFWLRRYG